MFGTALFCIGGKTGVPREKNPQKIMMKYQRLLHGGNLWKLLPKSDFLEARSFSFSFNFSSSDMLLASIKQLESKNMLYAIPTYIIGLTSKWGRISI